MKTEINKKEATIVKEIICKDKKIQTKIEEIYYIKNRPNFNAKYSKLTPKTKPILYNDKIYNTIMPISYLAFLDINKSIQIPNNEINNISKFKIAYFNKQENLLNITKAFGKKWCLLANEGELYYSTLPYEIIINNKDIIEKKLLLYYLKYESKESMYPSLLKRTDVNNKPDFIFSSEQYIEGVEITNVNLGFNKTERNDLFNTTNIFITDLFKKNEKDITLSGMDFLNKIQDTINKKNKLYPKQIYSNIDLMIFMDLPIFKVLLENRHKKIDKLNFRKILICFVDPETSEICLLEISKEKSLKKFPMEKDFLLRFFAKPHVINDILITHNFVKENSNNTLLIEHK